MSVKKLNEYKCGDIVPIFDVEASVRKEVDNVEDSGYTGFDGEIGLEFFYVMGIDFAMSFMLWNTRTDLGDLYKCVYTNCK